MYIITILTVAGNVIDIVDCYNDELIARTELIKTVSNIVDEGKGCTFEPIYMKMDLIYIYKKSVGYLSSSKELFKIVAMHEVFDYQCLKVDEE